MSSTNMNRRLSFDQRQVWRRAMRLNSPTTFSELRLFYRRIRSGAVFGLYSGYSP